MRWRELLECVEAEPGITPDAIATRMGVSTRSIRSFAREANERLGRAASLAKRRGGGYFLEIADEGAYRALMHSSPSLVHGVPATRAERVVYLLNDLLMRNDWVFADDLADACACSRSTLSLDLRDVEHILNRYDLVLERRPRYGMRVSGLELNRRLCLAASAMGDATCLLGGIGDAAPAPSSAPESLFQRMGMQRESLEAIAASVEDALTDGPININAISYQNLLVHIAIALVRINAGCYVPLASEDMSDIERRSEYAAARRVAGGIKSRLGMELPEEEVAYIAIHLAGKRTLNDALSNEEPEGGLVISDEIWALVSDMLDSVRTHFHFDFDEDIELRMNLARHLVPLAVRLRSQMNLKNPLLGDITTHYPLAWSMAVDACEVLHREFGTAPSNDEIGYIAMAFALALERQRSQAPRKRLLVVCASGAGSARLLKCRCQKEFGSYVESIETCDVMHVADVDFSRIDYVFTTVPISAKLPVPVREVPFFFDDAAADEIRDLLRFGDKGCIVAGHFDPELFFPHMRLTSKDEVLHFLCAAVRDGRSGYEELEPLVFEREAAATTSFGNMVAMPHPLESVSDDTVVAVALLDQPVVWDEIGTCVRAVFLICFSRIGGPELDAFLSALADVFTDEEAISRLVEHQDWSTLMELFQLESP